MKPCCYRLSNRNNNLGILQYLALHLAMLSAVKGRRVFQVWILGPFIPEIGNPPALITAFQFQAD